jgi:hypothetical protein
MFRPKRFLAAAAAAFLALLAVSGALEVDAQYRPAYCPGGVPCSYKMLITGPDEALEFQQAADVKLEDNQTSALDWICDDSTTLMSLNCDDGAESVAFGVALTLGAGLTCGGDLVLDIAGADADSPSVIWRGDQGGTDLDGAVWLQYGADPCLQIAVDDDNSSPVLTNVACWYDDALLFDTDNTVDIGANGATRPKDIYAAGDVVASGGAGAVTLTHSDSTIVVPAADTTAMLITDGTDTIATFDSTNDRVILTAFQYQDGNQAAGRVLESDADGNATWVVNGACSTLDEGYDCGGSGVGRSIVADTGAVAINGAGGLVLDNTGTDADSPVLSLRGDDGGVEEEATIQLINGATPELRFQVDDDNASPTLTTRLSLAGTQVGMSNFVLDSISASSSRIYGDTDSNVIFGLYATNDSVATQPVLVLGSSGYGTGPGWELTGGSATVNAAPRLSTLSSTAPWSSCSSDATCTPGGLEIIAADGEDGAGSAYDGAGGPVSITAGVGANAGADAGVTFNTGGVDVMVIEGDGDKYLTDGDLLLDDTGSDVNSPSLLLRGDDNGAELEASAQLIVGADPVLRFSVDDDNATPALTEALSLSDTVATFPGDVSSVTITASGNSSAEALLLEDTDASHYLTVAWNEDDAAGRTLDFKVNAGDRVIDLSADLTVEATATVNQDTTTDATPQFAGVTSTSDVVIDDTGTDTNSPNLYLRGDDGGVEEEAAIYLAYGAQPYIVFAADDDNATPVLTQLVHLDDNSLRPASAGGIALGSTSNYFSNVIAQNLLLFDSGNDHYLTLDWNEDEGANRVLSLTMDGDHTLALAANLTVESAATVNQDTTTDATGVVFGGLNMGAGTLELPNGTDLPATCNVGEIWHDTDDDACADAGGGDGALCICKSADTWALVSNF